MKLRLLTMLLVCAASLSCGEEWSESVGDKKSAAKKPIDFSTMFETRAAALTDPAGLAAKGGFKVWTYSHPVHWNTPPPPASKATLLDGATVTGNAAGTEWSYDSPVDWPSERFVSFFAFGPAGAATVNGATAENVPTVGFSVNPAPANQVDFLIARPIYDQTGPSYANGRAVNLRFEHALSRIVFSGFLLNEPESEPETRTIKIKSITLNGLYDTGTAALSSNPAVWTVSGQSNASYTLGTATGELKNVALTAGSQYVTAQDGYLFLMPQSLGRAAGQDATMTVTLDIDGQTIAYPPSPLFSPSSWESGKTYNYQIVINGDDLTVIGFEINPVILNRWEISEYINPVMMAAGKEDLNNRKIAAAMSSLEKLSSTTLPIPGSKYFALYFGGAMDMDVTIDMNDYSGFKIGDVVMLDAKKLITRWDRPGEMGSATIDNYFVEALFDETVWQLGDAAQPSPDIYSDPEVDATSGPTKIAGTGNGPSNKIQNRGSIILEKISDTEPPIQP